jgi:hypothetical protein
MFAHAGRELDRMPAEDRPWTDGQAARRARLVVERNALLDQIRSIPGFERFLLAPDDEEDLTRSPVDGPVVIVNLARHRCDALLVAPGGIRALPLPRVTHAEATSWANALLRAADQGGDASEQVLEDVLRWMWIAFVEDIVDALGLSPSGSDGELPRVWWIPTGPLTVLPLHAAGDHRDDATAGRRLLDRAVSSYAPSLRALRHAQEHADEALRNRRGLVVAVSDAPGSRRLPGARREGELVRDATGAATFLVDGAANQTKVLAALPDSAWVHFACHATTDTVDPFDSRLVLWDGPLPVREIAALRVRGATLAYLSACTTAFGGTSLADEAIHVASAFQLAGYPHVIGTLWEVRDRVARQAAEWMYAELAVCPPALAAHRTVRQLYDSYPRSPSLWASHIHIGP